MERKSETATKKALPSLMSDKEMHCKKNHQTRADLETNSIDVPDMFDQICETPMSENFDKQCTLSNELKEKSLPNRETSDAAVDQVPESSQESNVFGLRSRQLTSHEINLLDFCDLILLPDFE